MDNNIFIINNVNIVIPDGVIESGSVVIEEGVIKDIFKKRINLNNRINGNNCYLLPGLVDIHGDSLERAIAPRSGVLFPLDISMTEFDRDLSTHGITTIYYCVAFAELGKSTRPLRFREKALDLVKKINENKNKFFLRTFIHLRYEILDTGSIPIINELIENDEIDFFSLMDHTPGYGVFKDLEKYKKYFMMSGLSPEDAVKEYEEKIEMKKKVDMTKILDLVNKSRNNGIPVASHDDHDEEKVEWAVKNNISISEFSVTEEAVLSARKNNLYTVFGSANLVRGGSHVGNLSTSDMIKNKMADIICSDYSPMSMLHALYIAYMQNSYKLNEIVNLFTLHPARAAGIDNAVGSIEIGKIADMILVNFNEKTPRVNISFVDGEIRYSSIDYRY